MMSLIECASWMKAMMRICALHLGHSKGSTSYDMTFSSNPPYPHERITAFMRCEERMRAAKCDKKYPFMWTEGLAIHHSGEIAAVRDINVISADETLLGSYAELQVQVSRLISRELQLLIEPASDADPEAFMCQLINSACQRGDGTIESSVSRAA